MKEFRFRTSWWGKLILQRLRTTKMWSDRHERVVDHVEWDDANSGDLEDFFAYEQKRTDAVEGLVQASLDAYNLLTDIRRSGL